MLKRKAHSSTCIAVIQDTDSKLVIAADRRLNFGSEYQKSRLPKVVKRDHLIMAGCGDWFLCSLILYHMPIPEVVEDTSVSYIFNSFLTGVITHFRALGILHPSELRLVDGHPASVNNAEDGVEILIIYDSVLYQLTIDKESLELQILDIPFAAGCGGSYALGSLLTTIKYKMTATRRLTMALQIAASVSSYCDANIDIIKEGDDE